MLTYLLTYLLTLLTLLYFTLNYSTSRELYVYYFSKAIYRLKIVVYVFLNRPQMYTRPQRNAQVRFGQLSRFDPLEHPWKRQNCQYFIRRTDISAASKHMEEAFLLKRAGNFPSD